MLGSEKQVTEPERAGKKDVKFPGKQKWKNGQKFYILKYKEMATLSQGSLISLLKMSTQKKVKSGSEEAPTTPTFIWQSY